MVNSDKFKKSLVKFVLWNEERSNDMNNSSLFKLSDYGTTSTDVLCKHNICSCIAGFKRDHESCRKCEYANMPLTSAVTTGWWVSAKNIVIILTTYFSKTSRNWLSWELPLWRRCYLYNWCLSLSRRVQTCCSRFKMCKTWRYV